MPNKIFLTRPRASSERFAALLRQDGFDPHIEPLLTIEPIDAPRPFGTFQALLLTSASTLDALNTHKEKIADLLALPCFCVGAATGAAAQTFGFTAVSCGASDSAELARLMIAALTDKTRPLLHICGDIIDSKAQEILTQHGFTVTPWIVYHATATADFTPATRALFASGGLQAIPVFSPRSARILVALIEKNRLTHACHAIIAVGLSQAVIDVLQSLPWRRLCLAASPSEKDILACLHKEISMTQTAPALSVPQPSRKKKNRAAWFALTIVVLACVGAVMLARCPFLYPLLYPQPVIPITAPEQHVQNSETPADIQTENTAPATANDIALTEAIKNLQTQIAQMQNQDHQGQQAARQWAAAAIAFWDLRDAAKNGHNFTHQLAALNAVTNDDAAITAQTTKLAVYADEAVPTLSQLRDELAAQQTPAADTTEPTLLNRLKAIFKPLISVHPLRDAQISAVENALATGDSHAATDAFNTLPLPTQNTLAVWHSKLEKRVALDEAIQALTTTFVTLPTPGNTP